MLPTDAQERKATPIYSGVIKYFPNALAAVARVSKAGNDQHNPGQPMHWAMHKSTDEEDAMTRHLFDLAMGVEEDTDGQLHRAKIAWRALAALERYILSTDENAMNVNDVAEPELPERKMFNDTDLL